MVSSVFVSIVVLCHCNSASTNMCAENVGLIGNGDVRFYNRAVEGISGSSIALTDTGVNCGLYGRAIRR